MSALSGADGLGPSDFWPAFLAVAGVASLSALVFARPPADTGPALTRRPAPAGGD